MLDFTRILEVTLFFECSNDPDGKYHLDPKDPGGETKYGISKKAHPTVDIKSLTLDGAIHIYNVEYFATPGVVRLTDQVCAAKVFDMGVNFGVRTAVRMLEQSINKVFGFNKVFVNGVLGPIDALVVNTLTVEQQVALMAALKLSAKTRHLGLILIDKNNADYKDGWLRRDYWPYNQQAGDVWPYLPKEGEGWPGGS